MPASTVTTKGQTTIPKVVRDRLGLRPGDRLNFVITEDGTVVLSAAKFRVADLQGLLKHHAARPTVSIEDMDTAVRNAAVARLHRARAKKP